MQLLRFSKPGPLVALTVVWTAALFGIDIWKSPRPIGDFFKPNVVGAAANVHEPQIRLWLNHLCCSGCLDDLRSGLNKLGWVKEVAINGEASLPAREDVDSLADSALRNGANWVDLKITDLKRVDFVELDKAMREVGLVAERMDLSGITHFRIQAELNHMCCKTCSKAIVAGMDMAKSFRSRGQFTWLDSTSVDYEKKLVTVYPRYDNVVDVAELMAGLNHLGFAPKSARVLLGDHD